MDLSQIKKIIQLVEKAQISHLSVEEDGLKVEVKKELSNVASVLIPQAQQVVAANPVPVQTAEEPVSSPVDALNGCVEVKTEMVGSFYVSSSPEAEAFVKVGDTIGKGKVICIIEAMKLFNEIESEVDGVIEKVCVENGAPVEFGQTLFHVRPN
ncbi:acetyl-CoA carboxylase biotin carboxyl carrier protein [Candidatus Marinamargulisbacteria bacterium SCGC AAA071-K20]|nr:acetyl-CoA carboxylase biotin carboxyl carrier protein [Candidatus Marinamargulisbacteria bacterium SCGC AAA071-K20]